MINIKNNKIFDNIVSIVIALVVALIFRSLLFEAFVIPSGSMKPNLLVGDYLFVSKYDYGYSKYAFPFGLPIIKDRIFYKSPKRGDIVVFKYPGDNKTDYVKRLIGMPGDKIQLVDGLLFINNKAVKSATVGKETKDGVNYTLVKETLDNGVTYTTYRDYSVYNPVRNFGPIYVEDGHFFMMGDNRDYSKDSRFSDVGQIDKENLLGKPKMIFFSVDGSFLKFWTWYKIRFNRIFKIIQ